MTSTVNLNFTLKPLSHESRSDECDIGFSSEIYFAIHQFGNNFFLNRMSFKRKQALGTTSASELKRKKALSESTVNSQRIGIMLKLEALKTTLSVQGQRRVLGRGRTNAFGVYIGHKICHRVPATSETLLSRPDITMSEGPKDQKSRCPASKQVTSCQRALKITFFCFTSAAMTIKSEIRAKTEFSQFFKDNTCAQLATVELWPGHRISFVISRTLLNRGSLNRGSTVQLSVHVYKINCIWRSFRA